VSTYLRLGSGRPGNGQASLRPLKGWRATHQSSRRAPTRLKKPVHYSAALVLPKTAAFLSESNIFANTERVEERAILKNHRECLRNRLHASSDRSVISWPLTRIEPASGFRKPSACGRDTDLPTPLRPRMHKVWPAVDGEAHVLENCPASNEIEIIAEISTGSGAVDDSQLVPPAPFARRKRFGSEGPRSGLDGKSSMPVIRLRYPENGGGLSGLCPQAC